MSSELKRRVWCALVLLGALLPALASAESEMYDFEIVLFERPGDGGGESWPAAPQSPDRDLAAARLESLPGARKALGPAAYTLRQKGMIVHEHIAWRQVPRGRGSKTWYWVGDNRLSGLIRVTRGRYLHLETDLLLYDANSGRPHRIQLHRRMRSGELHYVDHPRLGILIQAERPAAPAAPDAAGPAAGEPKPVKPAGTAQPG
jgi:hypothetical protein